MNEVEGPHKMDGSQVSTKNEGSLRDSALAFSGH